MPLKTMFKILTFVFASAGWILSAHSQSFNQEVFKTHLRWSLKAKKGVLNIDKKGEKLVLRTLDNTLFGSLAGELSKTGLENSYFKKAQYTAGKNGAPSSIEVSLKDESVELFTFYKDGEEKHILDFWINEDLVAVKKAAIQKAPPKPALAQIAAPKKKAVAPAKKKPAKKKKVSVKKTIKKKSPSEYRDFRYGAAFVWDYQPFIPPLESEVNLAVKGPDYFYEIQDRPFSEGDKKETHMQLTVNFYRKQKWGLMTKSLELYEKRYGKDSNRDFNDFMKAVSLIKNEIKPKVATKIAKPKTVENEDGEVIQLEPEVRASKKGIFAAALAILENVVDRSEDYELKKASLRYLLEAKLRDDDHVGALQTAKRLYVEATGQFDDEMIVRSSRAILYSLAHLKQLAKMEEFLQNKAVIRVLPAQEGDAYIGYANLSKGQTDQVIARFAANSKGYAKPVHPAILFNTAEAYFRKAQYGKAINLFDQFAANHSFYDVAGFALLRIGLSYDLLGKKEDKVLKLYENAINKSANPKARFEAKVRYVGLRVARKRNPDEKDLETLSFLETTPAEKRAIDTEDKKLLWLTRLRSMLAQERYEDALAYLSSTPLDTLRQVERRTFHGDGAETILGIVQQAYLKEDYARAVKIWEIFKEKYEDKVAKNLYARYLVADSYLRLGLGESFQESLEALQAMKKDKARTFPRWVLPHKRIDGQDYVNELRLARLIRDKDWKAADALLEKLKGERGLNYNYYKGVVSFELKKYNKAVRLFEKLLVSRNEDNSLSPRQSLRMLSSYAESMYHGNDQSRFRRNASALLNDLRRSNALKKGEAIERIEYLYIESLNSEKKTDYALLERKTGEFLAEKKESVYEDRVKYLRGVALIRAADEGEGKRLLEELVNGKETPEYIKGLARSELSSLVLKNKTL